MYKSLVPHRAILSDLKGQKTDFPQVKTFMVNER
jgi:hypothetical protein